jgi:hypothetical protein
MNIPSWYRRDEEDISYVNGALNVLVAHYGTNDRVEDRKGYAREIQDILNDKNEWPSAIIAFREREEDMRTKHNKATKEKNERGVLTQELNLRNIAAVKKQFGIK